MSANTAFDTEKRAKVTKSYLFPVCCASRDEWNYATEVKAKIRLFICVHTSKDSLSRRCSTTAYILLSWEESHTLVNQIKFPVTLFIPRQIIWYRDMKQLSGAVSHPRQQFPFSRCKVNETLKSEALQPEHNILIFPLRWHGMGMKQRL